MVHMAQAGGFQGHEMELLTHLKDEDAEGSEAEASPRSISVALKPLAPLKPAYKPTPLAAAVAILFIVLSWPGGDMMLDGLPVPAAKKCLAILLSVSTLWATEAVPLYITSLLIPLLVVSTNTLLPPTGPDCPANDIACLQKRYIPYPTSIAAKELCGQFFDPTVLLFMAGFR